MAQWSDIAEEQKMQQNIDAEMKDMLTAERERNVFACQCLNVPMVLKTSYKVNVDALRALGKMIEQTVLSEATATPTAAGSRYVPATAALTVPAAPRLAVTGALRPVAAAVCAPILQAAIAANRLCSRSKLAKVERARFWD
jgi:hypothetical protein